MVSRWSDTYRKELIMTNSTIIYTKNHCPYCDMAKQLLAEKGVKYSEINISHAAAADDVLAQIRKITDRKTFPQIVLEGEYVGGYTDLRDHYYKK